jgi:hypothetical protein
MTAPAADPLSLQPMSETLSVTMPASGWGEALDQAGRNVPAKSNAGGENEPATCSQRDVLAERVLRTERLAEAASAAGEAMVELKVRAPSERASGLDPLRKGSLASTTIDALFALHREWLRYLGATRRLDGADVIEAAVTHSHGEGVARMTRRALGEIVGIIYAHAEREGRL